MSWKLSIRNAWGIGQPRKLSFLLKITGRISYSLQWESFTKQAGDALCFFDAMACAVYPITQRLE